MVAPVTNAVDDYLALQPLGCWRQGEYSKFAILALCGVIAFMVSFEQAFGGTFAAEKHSVPRIPRGAEYINVGDFAPDVDLCAPSIEGRIFLRSHFVKEIDKEERPAAWGNDPPSLARSIRKVRNVTFADSNDSNPLHNVARWCFSEVFDLNFSPKNAALIPIALRHFHMDVGSQLSFCRFSRFTPLDASDRNQTNGNNDEAKREKRKQPICDPSFVAKSGPVLSSFLVLPIAIVVGIIGLYRWMRGHWITGAPIFFLACFLAFSGTIGLLIGLDLWSIWSGL